MKVRELRKVVFSYPRLAEFVGGDKLKRAKCLDSLEEIRAHYTPSMIKRIKVPADAMFGKMYDGINFELPPGLDLLELSREHNLILVPNHQSHLDYLALNYTLHKEYRYKLPIHIAGGVNLNVFPVGGMFRKSGCFFIRRSFINDRAYRYAFEGYLYYLLQQRIPIEFFFEGGRSRTGKLMPPRFGLFGMILDVHKVLLEQGHEWPLCFVPISIMHEFVPEERSMVKELGGGRKKRESSAQLFKLWRFMTKKFGTIHIKVGQPMRVDGEEGGGDRYRASRKLAFRCYRAVGTGMSVTPTALLSLILLDDPSGALIFEDILAKAVEIVEYCQHFRIPVTLRLQGERMESTLRRAMELLIRDKRIVLLKKEKLEEEFYVVEDNRRVGLLYFKNSSLHHFLIPLFMNSLLINIVNDRVKNLNDLKYLLKEQRDLLKYEFYLPEIAETIRKSLEIVRHATGRPVADLGEVLHLSMQEFFKVAKLINPFTRSSSYIYEGYYVGCLALKHFAEKHFSSEKFLKVAKEIHEMEYRYGRLVQFRESYSVPLLKNALRYYRNKGLLRTDGGLYMLVDPAETEVLIGRLAQNLTEHLAFNLKTFN